MLTGPAVWRSYCTTQVSTLPFIKTCWRCPGLTILQLGRLNGRGSVPFSRTTGHLEHVSLPSCVTSIDRACPSGLAQPERWVATGLEEALSRKDAIIRVRNAQISALWDELHTRQPWKNVLDESGKPIIFAGPAENATTRALVVLGINTVGFSVTREQL